MTRQDGSQADEWSDLMRAALAGDAAAYACFLRAVSPVLRGVVRARGGAGGGRAGRLNAEACEDIVQEVMLAIHLKRHTWRESEPIRPWLYAIARYKVIDAFRARGARIDLPVEDFAEVLAAPDAPDPLEARDVDRMIGMLDPGMARIVRGIGVEGASIAEVADRNGMSEGAVRVALHRGLKRLAELRKRHVE